MGTTLTDKTFAQIFAVAGGINGTRVRPTGGIEAAVCPRFDYHPVTKEGRGFLVEPSRTNTLRQSVRFDQSPWTLNAASVVANAAVSPTGQQDAAKIILSSAGSFGEGNIAQPTVKPNAVGAYVASAYLKPAGGNSAFIYVCGTSASDSISAQLDLVGNNHSVSSTGAFNVISHGVTDAGNGWRRYDVAFFSDASSHIFYRLYPGGPNPTGLGDDVAGMYAWGAQLEAGSFLTSVILTGNDPLERSGDIATIFNVDQAPWINMSEGTVYTRFVQRGAPLGVSQMVLGITSNLTVADRMLVYFDGDNLVGANVYRQGVEQATVAVPNSVAPAGQVRKVALSWKAGRLVLQVDALPPVSAAMPALPDYSAPGLFLGHRNGGADPLCAAFEEFVYWPKAANAAEIAAITPSTDVIAG
ncbi:phage head spike fiber domain-containing protein [Variovorax sp.]|uniref:phage head spike fiber domain-containing protein n=1 Tax=Variovorax sp. TaxID=1871043 RepID=UPI003BA8AD86